MKGFRLSGLLLVSALMVASLAACAGGSAATSGKDSAAHKGQSHEADPANSAISQEMYDDTLAEVRLFIENLNTIIRSKNYAAWKDTLSDESFEQISSPEFLASASESAVLKARRVVLKTPNDYFLQVVVPSRSQSRVDEIEFTDAHTVKVYYLEAVRKDNQLTGENRRLRLYELRKTGDTWKIVD